MKKAILRKLRTISEDVLGEEETNKIINDTVSKVLDETKPKSKNKKKKSDNNE
jgi:hypothetical protein